MVDSRTREQVPSIGSAAIARGGPGGATFRRPRPEPRVPDLLDRITLGPDQCGGHRCIRGMRIRVADVLQLLAAGETPEQILADYPYLERDDITAALQYAAPRLDHPTLAA